MPRNGSGVYSKPAGTTAVPNTVIESAKYNSVVDDIAADLNTARPITAGGTGATSAADARTGLSVYSKAEVDATVTANKVRGYVSGLIATTNGTDAANDVDISSGVASADTAPYPIMASDVAITKRIDAAWAVGSGNGGLDTGSIGNNTYYLWEIQRSDTLVTDFLFSLSNTAPTMPASYDRKRLLARIVRAAGVNGPPISLTPPQNPLLGTVSQANGVPTGAIIERGSNANGEFTKWADGTLECWNNSFLIKAAADGATGVKSAVWTYPSAFSANPYIAHTISSSGPNTRGQVSATTTTTAATLYYNESAGIASDVFTRPFAKGRWF